MFNLYCLIFNVQCLEAHYCHVVVSICIGMQSRKNSRIIIGLNFIICYAMDGFVLRPR